MTWKETEHYDIERIIMEIPFIKNAKRKYTSSPENTQAGNNAQRNKQMELGNLSANKAKREQFENKEDIKQTNGGKS